MDNALHYLALNRQVGLAAELGIVANNVANIDTTGFRREGLAFTEFVLASDGDSVSMADLGARFASQGPGEVSITNGRLDLAIEGDGYFVIEARDGPVLTRAGAFQTSQEGFLTTANGERLLDAGQAPIQLPPGAKDVLIATDGTVSVNGDPITQIALVDAPPELISRYGDTAFRVEADAFDAVTDPKIRQGALERSNVDPVLEVARMIEVTRAYEMAQSLIENEDDRIRNTIQVLGRTA